MADTTNGDLRYKVASFIQKEFIFGTGQRMLGPEDPLLASDGGVVDSVGLQRLIVYIESELNVPVDDLDVLPENFETLDRLYAFLDSKCPT